MMEQEAAQASHRIALHRTALDVFTGALCREEKGQE